MEVDRPVGCSWGLRGDFTKSRIHREGPGRKVVLGFRNLSFGEGVNFRPWRQTYSLFHPLVYSFPQQTSGSSLPVGPGSWWPSSGC